MKMTLSATPRANSISCVTTIIVLSPDFNPLMTFSTSPVSSGSSAEVGSSKHRMSGESASARAYRYALLLSARKLAGIRLGAVAQPPRGRGAPAHGLSMSPKRRSAHCGLLRRGLVGKLDKFRTMRGFKRTFFCIKLVFRQIFAFQTPRLATCARHARAALLRLGFGVYGGTLSAALFFAQKLRRELDVGDGVVVREEVELLEHQPEMQHSSCGCPPHSVSPSRAAVKEHFAVHGDGAFVRRFKEIEAAEQRRLAAARQSR